MNEAGKKELSQLVEKIKLMKAQGEFGKYIDEIYFPRYKSFDDFSKISFDFPLTVLVGKNGSGKSSILHALYGCPKGNTPAKYWFSSITDPIQDKDSKNMAQCFVYTYHDNKVENQVAMKRSSRPGTKHRRKDPDYWETEKPRKMYLMNTDRRCPPVEWPNMYIDFRQELSAYDKFLYFGDVKDLHSATKQDFVRGVAPMLNKALADPEKIYHVRNKAQNEQSVPLNNEELHFISKILGVTYVSGRLIRHHFYRNWGVTAMIQKNDFSYTEAHAGSGEFAVIMLVHQLSSLKPNESNFILLDEPETSLYPGAQQRLLQYILQVICRTKSQIVISTHSEKFISCLPDCAVKAIKYDERSKNTTILNSCSPTNVFNELEISVSDQCVVYVEDRATELLLTSVISKNEDLTGIVVQKMSSGASTMLSRNVLTSSERSVWDDYYFFDGDQKPEDIINFNSVPEKQLRNPNFLDEMVKQVSSGISFPSSRSRNQKSLDVNDSIKMNAEIKYLKFVDSNVKYLPLSTPEDIIWNEEFLTELVGVMGIDVVIDSKRKKETFLNISRACVSSKKVNNEQYYNFMDILCKHWTSTQYDSQAYKDIKEGLFDIIHKFENLHR